MKLLADEINANKDRLLHGITDEVEINFVQ